MADDNMDICECIWSHELAMRRLLSLLRQSQSHCTDTECIEELTSLPSGGQLSETNSFVMMAMLWMVVALVLFLLRPRSLRSSSADSKPRNTEPDNNDGRPPQPPSVNWWFLQIQLETSTVVFHCCLWVLFVLLHLHKFMGFIRIY